ncbi:MAG: alpha/beta hydrolase [Leptolyngbyaceae cyanobacterium MAG.088]|nr:alpha/beta hydrolase [Leptolyngbyaceae cyanobacterium MAG.088]
MSDRATSTTINFGSIIYLKNKQSNQYLISANAGKTKRYYWPYLSTNSKKKVALQLVPSSGRQMSFIQSLNWWLNPFHNRSQYYETSDFKNNDLVSGAELKIKTSESKVGNHDTLGAFRDSDDCYYWEEGYDDLRQGWILTKVDPKTREPITDKEVHIYDGDEVYITNLAKGNQRLAADDRDQGYITTKEGASDSWIVERAPQRQIGEDEWFDYYKTFSYFSPEAIREGCYPRIMKQEKPTEKAIVLVHGLTDSPYFMTAIADHFFKLNYNVYIPLLKGHGLKIPSGMEGVSLSAWQANVKFAIEAAAKEATQISIGGLSTGGALSCYMAEKHSEITGAVYLFSAALRIAGGMGSGNIKESLLRSFMANLLDSRGPLIGENPYRYGRMDKDGARVLSEQIKEIDKLIKTLSPKSPFPKPVFAAHSEWDDAAAIQGIEALSMVSDLNQFRFFRIQREAAVGHAELVLSAPVQGASRILEYSNPKFAEMMDAITEFDQVMTEKTNQAGIFQLEALRDRLQAQEDLKQEDLKQEDLQDTEQEQKAKVDSMVERHRQILAEPEALIRYATIAQAVYDLESANQQLESLDCELIDESERADTWFLDGLQAMCVRYPKGGTDELILAYRGTDKFNPADLITDGSIGRMLVSFSGDDIARAVIRSAMEEKIPLNADEIIEKTLRDVAEDVAVYLAEKVTLAGQIAGRLVNAMKYYEEKADNLDFGQYRKITVVGHSLGGLIAAHVAYWANVQYEREIHCHTFNSAPGAKYTSMDEDGNLVYGDGQYNPDIANRIINHRIIGDSVSGLPLPIGADEEGFPYAHLGYIYNWRPFEADSYTSIAVHSLEQFIQDLKFETEHLVGIAPAPVGTVYW